MQLTEMEHLNSPKLFDNQNTYVDVWLEEQDSMDANVWPNDQENNLAQETQDDDSVT